MVRASSLWPADGGPADDRDEPDNLALTYGKLLAISPIAVFYSR